MTVRIPALIIIISISLILVVVLNKETDVSGQHKGNAAALQNTQTLQDKSDTSPEQTFITNPLHKLNSAESQCDNNIPDFGSEVQEIHQILISALQHELQQGKTVRDLLAYSDQYQTFYSSYDGLLWEAQTNNEKDKYQLTHSAAILGHWKGLSIIDGLSATSIPILVAGLKSIEGKSSGLNMELSLTGDISKEAIYQLLDNDDTFSTYLQSPLSIAGSPVISPSILFVLAAPGLSLDEFKQAVSMQSFTVNDVAVAIRNDMPIEYLKVLLQYTTAVSDMPVFSHNRHDAYANLADLAVAKHNTELLEILESNGVIPTNEPGIITAMDIAIMNLPADENAFNADRLPAKYLNTLNYLRKKGYAAHGSRYQHAGVSGVAFQAPNRRAFSTGHLLIPELKTLLHNIEIIDNSYAVVQISADESAVSFAIRAVQVRKDALNSRSAYCQSLKTAQLADEGFFDTHHLHQLIDDIKKSGGDIPQQLHKIDPVLVNVWQEYESAYKVSISSSTPDSDFITLLHEKQYQLAMDHVVTTSLNQTETDALLTLLPEFTEQLLPIWLARISPQPPASLFIFRYLSLEKWQELHRGGFDFSIKDRFEHDMFIPAALHSDTAIGFLLANGYTAETGKFGLDVFDLLLEDSYEQGRLHPNIKDIIPMVSVIEPSHFARIARLQKFYPEVYQQLISLNKALTPAPGTELNKFRKKS